MSAIGPSLPPHLLAKRKRQQEEAAQNAATTTAGAEASNTSAAEQSQQDKRRRLAGPDAHPPASDATTSSQAIGATSPPPPSAVAGPTLPPAPLDERPTYPANPTDAERDDSEASSDSDDDFGPSLPTAADLDRKNSEQERRNRLPTQDTQPAKAKRDDWMMVPPTQDDLSSRMDPTKLRARTFNTFKSARAPGPSSGGLAAEWTETPEQKLKRLQNEAMGVKGSGAADFDAKEYARNREQEEKAKRIKQHTDNTRGPSMIARHQKEQKIEEDDPSKRAFDREKDIGGRMVGRVQREEMLKKAGDFSTKFSGGKYL